MTPFAELKAAARALVDEIPYLTVGTADADGTPWVSPVWFAHLGYETFFWVSSPDARHSRNLAARPQVSLVVFDTTVPVGEGRGVYVSAVAEELDGEDVERGIVVLSRESVAQGAPAWTAADVRAPARLRLYRATAGDQFLLTAGDRRVPVRMG